MFEVNLDLLFRSVIGGVFFLSFIGKVRNMHSFESAIRSFEVVPSSWASSSSRIFVLLEFVVFVLMIFGTQFAVLGYFFAAILLSVFAVALVLVLRKRFEVPCNCFGTGASIVTSYDVVRNLLLVSISILAIALSLSETLTTAAGITAESFIFTTLLGLLIVALIVNSSDIVTLYANRKTIT